MRRTLIGLGAALALMTQPVAAQDEGPDEEAFAAMMAMFKPEPLTEEQEERLPKARSIVDKMIPPGTLGDMMGSMFDKILDPIMSMATKASSEELSGKLGIELGELDLNEEQTAEIAAILDPAWQERREREAAVMPKLMTTMMSAMEPGMRKAMSEAYAVYFNDQELSDIDAFFSTESGIAFARKSFTMSSDPRVLGASMEAMPAMFESIATIESEMEAATADLPEPRKHADLSAAQRARLAELAGISVGELDENMLAAEAFADAMAEVEAESETAD